MSEGISLKGSFSLLTLLFSVNKVTTIVFNKRDNFILLMVIFFLSLIGLIKALNTSRKIFAESFHVPINTWW